MLPGINSPMITSEDNSPMTAETLPSGHPARKISGGV
jgi:hypothetical protein